MPFSDPYPYAGEFLHQHFQLERVDAELQASSAVAVVVVVAVEVDVLDVGDRPAVGNPSEKVDLWALTGELHASLG